MKKVFSGVQPTGNIHLGNYLGAMRQFTELQDEYDTMYCIVDLHSITVEQDPAELKAHILDVAALYLAIGVDPKKATIFVQSNVPAHSELAWLLMCNSYTGELSRMTQYKEKSKGNESSIVGLFTYPVLMAADILLYDTDVVPVGEDQRQHLELTRDIARRFNTKYGETFTVPEARTLKTATRIMSLDDPGKKMSKSNESEYSRIALLDDEKKISKVIAKAQTDSEGHVRYDVKNKPAVSNLINIYATIAGKTKEEVEDLYKDSRYSDFKKDLAAEIERLIKPIREKFSEVRGSKELVDILKEGGMKAKDRAEIMMKKVPIISTIQTTVKVKDKIGLGY